MGFSELIFNTNVDKNLITNYMMNEGKLLQIHSTALQANNEMK